MSRSLTGARHRLVHRCSVLLAALTAATALLAVPTSELAHAEPGVTARPSWAVLLCKFADRDQEPRTVDGYRRLFTAAGAGTGGFSDYWRDQSHGQHQLDARVFGWFRLSVTNGEYNSWGFDRPRKAQACMNAARGVDLRAYDGVVVVTNTEGDYTGFPYERRIGGQVKRWSVAILHGRADVAAAVQEMSHGYALGHSWSTETPGVPAATCPPECEYGDTSDVMSAGNSFSVAGPYGPSGPGFNAHHREWFGWLAPARIATHTTAGCTSCRRSYRIADLNSPSTPGLLMVKIPTASPGHYFTVAYRRPTGWDRGLPRAAVQVHEVRPNGVGYLVKRGQISHWLPGQTLQIAAPAPITITVAADTTDASVTVTVDRRLPAPRWTRLGTGIKDITPSPAGVYALDARNGALLQRSGTGERWTRIGDPGSQLAANDRFLVATDPARESVLLFDGRAWNRIGGPAHRLVVGGQSVYAVQPVTGDLWRYDGTPFRWTKVGGRGRQFVVNDTGLYALSADGRNVLRFTGTPGVWQTILTGSRARALITTPTDLFAVSAPNGDLLRYDGRPGAWTRVGGPATEVAGNRNGLYALTPNRAAVMRWTGTAGRWEQIGGPASRIAAAGTHLYATTPSGDAVFVHG